MLDMPSHTEKTSKNIYKAKSPKGLQQDCAIKSLCRSCRYINTDYKSALNTKYQAGIDLLKEAKLLGKAHLIAPPVSNRPLGYRTHAKLAVRPAAAAVQLDKGSRFAIGLFQPESHKVVDISSCPLHKPTINKMVVDLKAALDSTGLAPYDEVNHSGDLRYIAVRASHITDELMVTFVMTDDSRKNELKDVVQTLKDLGHQIQSVYVNINPEVTNSIFGDTSKRLLGSDRLREGLCDFIFEIGPTSFFQVNPWEAERIYRRIEHLSGVSGQTGVAWDFYCGVGQIAMLLARAGYRVLGVEMNPQAIRDAQKNAHLNLAQGVPHFVAGKVEAEIAFLPTWAQSPQLIVTNPARKGIDPEALSFLAQTMKHSSDCELLYLSCEVNSLRRDLEAFATQGIYARQLEAFDMFPYTEKMEWLAVLK